MSDPSIPPKCEVTDEGGYHRLPVRDLIHAHMIEVRSLINCYEEELTGQSARARALREAAEQNAVEKRKRTRYRKLAGWCESRVKDIEQRLSELKRYVALVGMIQIVEPPGLEYDDHMDPSDPADQIAPVPDGRHLP